MADEPPTVHELMANCSLTEPEALALRDLGRRLVEQARMFDLLDRLMTEPPPPPKTRRTALARWLRARWFKWRWRGLSF